MLIWLNMVGVCRKKHQNLKLGMRTRGRSMQRWKFLTKIVSISGSPSIRLHINGQEIWIQYAYNDHDGGSINGMLIWFKRICFIEDVMEQYGTYLNGWFMVVISYNYFIWNTMDTITFISNMVIRHN